MTSEFILSERHSSPADYTSVTELPGIRATADQRRILFSRYDLARQFSNHADVLEVACGSGIGLGYLARRARAVVGGDINESSCAIAARTCVTEPNISVRRLDAQQLDFPNESFDVIVLFEALYYLDDPDAFFREAQRVLRPRGTLLVSTANRAWPGFNASPFSKRYFNAIELRRAMESRGFRTRILAGFPEKTIGARAVTACIVRRLAVHLGVIPKTMRGKEWLKRIFYGRLEQLPAELPEKYAEPEPLLELTEHDIAPEFRIIYAIGHRN